jgi:polyvinyl alcohol dehydrogenase (cytochrome)
MDTVPRFHLYWIALLVSLAAPLAMASECTESTPGLSTFYSDGWGIDKANTRFQADSKTTINAANVSRLKLKWVYGLASDTPRSFPLVTEDTIFIGDGAAGVVALDRETGCRRWIHARNGDVGSAIVHQRKGGQVTLFFNERRTEVVAVNAADGKVQWTASPGDNPVPMYSGSPLVYQDSIYVPLSSMEVALAMNPFYGCCTTSGGLSALGSATGIQRWHVRSVPDLPQLTGRHYLFVEEHGPSGAPVWGPPTLDVKRGLLFFGTGQNYSRPASKTSDAIFAIDIEDGSTRWSRQFTAGDAYNLACGGNKKHVNCPDPVGPDVDFGAPPILTTTAEGRDILLAGQKSGDVHAMDPATGEILWQTMGLGRGGALGGIHWGMAVNPLLNTLFVPISDIGTGLDGDGPARPGLQALDISTGSVRWVHEREPRCPERSCAAGLSAAITATSDLVFAGALDGKLLAIDARSGELLWSHDSLQEYESVNQVPARGGSYDAHGPMLADDLLIISSGYGTFGQKGGNALLVFQLEGESP